jgi:hypothetical protein
VLQRPVQAATVIWEFAGESIPALLRRVERIADRVPVDVAASFLGDDEIDASSIRRSPCARACSPPTARDTATRGPWLVVVVWVMTATMRSTG